MSSLHILRVSNPHPQALLCLANLRADDTLLFVDDGCYNLKRSFIDDVLKIIPPANCCTVTDHLKARAIQYINPKIALLDYQQIVTMCLKAKNIITWQ